MKLLSESSERKWYVVQEWTTRVGLQACVLQCVWDKKITRIASSLHPFFTGYVLKQTVDATKYYDNPEISVHGGVTFEGEMNGDFKDKAFENPIAGTWVGFDMSHYGDEDMQDLAYAVEECEKLAEQMVHV